MADLDNSTGKCRTCCKPTKRFVSSGRYALFCSSECRTATKTGLTKEESDAKRVREGIQRNTFTCLNCGSDYVRRRRHLNEGKKYCSRQCAFAGHKAWMSNGHEPAPLYTALPKYSQVQHKHCLVCGDGFYSRTNGRNICSASCYSVNYGRANKQLEPIECKECSITFVPEYGDQRTVFCSSVCAKRYGKRIERKKYGANNRSRARKYGVYYEPVNKLKVFERDGWRCQVCGISTPQSKKGSRHHNAPELDHRIALAAGGAHSYENTQCACRQCNNDKGAHTTVGQLPLFAQML